MIVAWPLHKYVRDLNFLEDSVSKTKLNFFMYVRDFQEPFLPCAWVRLNSVFVHYNYMSCFQSNIFSFDAKFFTL